MRIGVDLDGVVFNSEEMFRAWAELNDIELGGHGVSHPEELKVLQRYDWPNEECSKFLDNYLLPVLEVAPLMPLAKEVINMLRSDGHEFIAITSRFRPGEVEITERRMKEEGFDFPVVYTGGKKAQSCLDNKIDVMVEDFYGYVEEMADAGITCIQLVPPPIKEVHRDNVFICRNWGEIYRTIIKLCEKSN